VDLIIHPAAYVNHVLPYGQLFGPNVAGTAEVIRLALTTRRKPVTYLSTIAVTDQIDPSLFDEDSDIRKISPVRTVDDSYANGYSNSKWAGEVLLREAHEKYGLPVAVFRSNMILAHSRYTGQLNTTDTFTRLLLSLLATGVAPKSFYQADSRGNRQHVNYDGLPADFTAAAITALGTQITDGYITYNIVNPHGDGIGLDDIVDWLAATVSPIQQIEDYSEWFGRFEAALHALPENQRRQSVLPILDTYRQPARPGPAISAARFQAATSAAASRIDNRTARLSTRLIDKYVGDLRQRQLVTI
jgi:fatty acid CoA ligase FadD9